MLHRPLVPDQLYTHLPAEEGKGADGWPIQLQQGAHQASSSLPAALPRVLPTWEGPVVWGLVALELLPGLHALHLQAMRQGGPGRR